MTEILPFRGILYNQEKISNLSDVVAPPYDVISPGLQERLYQKHPNNVIRLILGKINVTDTEENNRYTRAASYLQNWLAENLLVRDTESAFYLSAVDFIYQNRVVTRYGLICLVRLEPFEKGIVLPHERTFSKVKYDRFKLMKACHANFSPIFSLYSDQEQILRSLKEAVVDNNPDLDLVDTGGCNQRLWRITDPGLHNNITRAMADKIIFIADGHHRYETCLNYRDWVKQNSPAFSENHPANYVMMSLSSIEDPGLVILPAHRMLSEVRDEVLDSLIDKAGQFFEIESFPFQEQNKEKARSRFISELKAGSDRNCIGVFIKNSRVYHLLMLKPGVMEEMFSEELPKSLLNLDVTVLTRLVFMEILGFDQKRLDNEKLINYSSQEKEALETVSAGEYDVTFILNPTKIEQVQQIARQGLIMPRKSTYFYPKVISGHVINTLLPA